MKIYPILFLIMLAFLVACAPTGMTNVVDDPAEPLPGTLKLLKFKFG
jgi:hypothetical protein